MTTIAKTQKIRLIAGIIVGIAFYYTLQLLVTQSISKGKLPTWIISGSVETPENTPIEGAILEVEGIDPLHLERNPLSRSSGVSINTFTSKWDGMFHVHSEGHLVVIRATCVGYLPGKVSLRASAKLNETNIAIVMMQNERP
jgi:hypothetical protein